MTTYIDNDLSSQGTGAGGLSGAERSSSAEVPTVFSGLLELWSLPIQLFQTWAIAMVPTLSTNPKAAVAIDAQLPVPAEQQSDAGEIYA